MKRVIILALIIVISSQLASTQTYTPVDAGSKIHFSIKNFGINTSGDFTGLKGTIVFNPDNIKSSSFDVTVDANTIDTDNKTRDGHLRKKEYFDVETYKTLHYKSREIVKIPGNKYYVYGELTIKGVSKPVEFSFDATPKDNGYIFAGGFEINRRDFGVGGGSMSMADKLKVTLTVEAKK